MCNEAYFELNLRTNCSAVTHYIKRSKVLCKVCSLPFFVCKCLLSMEGKKKIEDFQYLLTVSLSSERHILSLTKAYTRLSPRVWWQWCRKSELPRTPLFSKHSYWGEELIIQSQGPRQPHLIAPQKKGQSFSYEEHPGSAPCQLMGWIQYLRLNGSLANSSIKRMGGVLVRMFSPDMWQTAVRWSH